MPREVAAHFAFGMMARCDTTEEFQYHRIVDDE